MREYKPSTSIPPARTSFLVVASILSGLLIGGAASLLSRVFYLIFVFPIAMGFVGMMAVFWIHKRARVPNRFVIIISGLITGALIYTAYHYADYLAFRVNGIRTLKEEYSIDGRQAAQGVDYILHQQTGAAGFPGFIKLHAREGNTYGGVMLFNQTFVIEMPKFTLKGAWIWAYWLFEAVIILGATTLASISIARDPFCEDGSDWYGLSRQIGNVDVEHEKAFLDLLGANDFSRAGEMIIEGEMTTHPTIEVYAQHCKTGLSSTVLMTVKRTCLNPKSQVERETLLYSEISQEHYRELVESPVPQDV